MADGIWTMEAPSTLHHQPSAIRHEQASELICRSEHYRPGPENLARRQELLQRRALTGRRVGEGRCRRQRANAPHGSGVRQVVEIDRGLETLAVEREEL